MYIRMTNDEREKIGAVKYDKIHSNAGLELPKTSTTEKAIVAIASERMKSRRKIEKLELDIYQMNGTLEKIGNGMRLVHD